MPCNKKRYTAPMTTMTFTMPDQSGGKHLHTTSDSSSAPTSRATNGTVSLITSGTLRSITLSPSGATLAKVGFDSWTKDEVADTKSLTAFVTTGRANSTALQMTPMTATHTAGKKILVAI
eukprot:1085181-Prorocentrum_lima.AAC.1